MALARTRAVALFGVDGQIVDVEAAITNGVPGLHLVGLPDTALSEARDRVRAAILHSGENWPNRHVTVSLFPASLPKRGSGFDIAIAVAVLGAGEALPTDACAGLVMIGELGLDGRIRPVSGVLPAVLAAADSGADTVIVAKGNAAEASLVPDVKVVAVGSLRALLARLRDLPPPEDPDDEADVEGPAPHTDGLAARSKARRGDLDLADVRGQAEGRKILEVSAAGGHHVCFMGPPGCGKTMLAERLPTLLPDLERGAALEVTAIHSVAGTLPAGQPLITRPPFQAPHHTASRAALVGGGSARMIQPGAASLAHRGILFLDEGPEFGGGVLDALRQPLEEGEVVIARSGATARFPARFTMLLAANPCPCAAPKVRDCSCAPSVRRRYLARLSGPLLDRVDLKSRLKEVTRAELRYDLELAESSEVVAERVLTARDRTRRRLADTPWRTNAEIPGRELRRRFAPPGQALATLDRPLADGRLSARGLDRVVRVAWTLTDLIGKEGPTTDEINQALALWEGRT
ncbi:YifB family Mg chelatase-like AAA ATPase [Actinoallomurus bryophytorum]|uniref:Magnesium chelatase family protein n=1 Tax=Actinoallomurus bryophytorum TaxID=1490222 RepID=A0A543CDM5_9ACTN|nr:YifB family Mg chelatase-like AAA ATPase [Actinoallomurus bryophytorum]TQL95202.1 magnesium chelatase family protein [Actinoallomurus bryophytorum]